MSFKDKIINIVVAPTKIVTFGIGLAITFVMATALGVVDHQQVFAQTNTNMGGNSATR